MAWQAGKTLSAPADPPGPPGRVSGGHSRGPSEPWRAWPARAPQPASALEAGIAILRNHGGLLKSGVWPSFY